MEAQTPDNPFEWQIGQTTFQSFDDAFIQISTFSHSVRGNLRVPRRNIRCFELACKEKECTFEAYISYDKKRATYVLRRWNEQHTCIGVQQKARGSMHSAAFVEAKVCRVFTWVFADYHRSGLVWQ